jgi:hypothetical protein
MQCHNIYLSRRSHLGLFIFPFFDSIHQFPMISVSVVLFVNFIPIIASFHACILVVVTTKAPKMEAIITLVTSDDFVAGAEVLAHSIRKVGTRRTLGIN